MRLITLLALGVTAAGHLAMAQVPPHVPGTICMTPYFWCWAEEQGRVGDVCSCYLLDEALLDAFEGDIDRLSEEEFEDLFYEIVDGVHG